MQRQLLHHTYDSTILQTIDWRSKYCHIRVLYLMLFLQVKNTFPKGFKVKPSQVRRAVVGLDVYWIVGVH